MRVFEAADEYWREREPALLMAMNARLDTPPDSAGAREA
jgi:hypothetical protein